MFFPDHISLQFSLLFKFGNILSPSKQLWKNDGINFLWSCSTLCRLEGYLMELGWVGNRSWERPLRLFGILNYYYFFVMQEYYFLISFAKILRTLRNETH